MRGLTRSVAIMAVTMAAAGAATPSAIAGPPPAPPGPPPPSDTGVSLHRDQLLIIGGSAPEWIKVEREGGQFVVTSHNESTVGLGGPRCTAVDPHEVNCPIAGVVRVYVALSEGNDRFFVGRRFPASDERGFCRGNELGAKLRLNLGRGRNYAETSAGVDVVTSGKEHDVLLGCQGDDSLYAGGGRDEVGGDRGDDLVIGAGGPDWLVGCGYDPDDSNYPIDERGDDELRGGPAGDFLFGCDGDDEYLAGDGDDDLNTRDERPELVDCGEGGDLVFGDSTDRLAGCERTTRCNTDNYPFLPCDLRTTGTRTPRAGLINE